MHLDLFAADTGEITTRFTPTPHHIGFTDVIHGGVLATVADEAQVWSAIWHTRRPCLAGELSIRFKQKGNIGQPIIVAAKVIRARQRFVETECDFKTEQGDLIATSTAKYLALVDGDMPGFINTLIQDERYRTALDHLRRT